MLKGRLCKILAVSLAMTLAGLSLHAQDGAYTGFTPYSIFGIGDIFTQGSAYNKGMGGVGIATRNKRYINYLNPASITARDSLAFMADMSVNQSNRYFRQGDMSSAINTFNVNSITISVPLFYPYSAMLVGIAPYSSTGYRYSYILDDPAVIGNTGNAVYYSAGTGGTYQLFGSTAVTLWRRLSLGVEGRILFGKIAKESVFSFAKSAYSNINSGNTLVLRGSSAKFGLQYEQPVGNSNTIGIGATYSTGINLKGTVEDYRISVGSAQSDTLRFSRDTLGRTMGGVSVPNEIGIGLSFNHSDNWRAEINYSRSDWTHSGMDVAKGFAVKGSSYFDTRVSQTYRAGFEIVPNRNDIRYYYKRCAYRVGAYYEDSRFAVDGNQIKDIGLTFGASLPVFRYYNALTFAVGLGQRASTAGNMIRERYVNFTVGFSFHDMWFRKLTYM
ncbi:MAG: hypothetical protein IKO24_03105 [Bacteroidales bacterium]|nr:hypothetical protein [Bacteroidales bacterium]